MQPWPSTLFGDSSNLLGITRRNLGLDVRIDLSLDPTQARTDSDRLWKSSAFRQAPELRLAVGDASLFQVFSGKKSHLVTPC